MLTYRLTFIKASLIDDIRKLECNENAVDELVEVMEELDFILVRKELLDSSNT